MVSEQQTGREKRKRDKKKAGKRGKGQEGSNSYDQESRCKGAWERYAGELRSQGAQLTLLTQLTQLALLALCCAAPRGGLPRCEAPPGPHSEARHLGMQRPGHAMLQRHTKQAGASPPAGVAGDGGDLEAGAVGGGARWRLRAHEVGGGHQLVNCSTKFTVRSSTFSSLIPLHSSPWPRLL